MNKRLSYACGYYTGVMCGLIEARRASDLDDLKRRLETEQKYLIKVGVDRACPWLSEALNAD